MTILYRDLIANKKLRDKMRNRVLNAIKRCHNEKSTSYPRYGAVGVTVLQAWRENRREFIKYLMTLPGWDNLELELDRINSNEGYIPGNLRFVTRLEQSRNKDYGLKITFASGIYTLPDFYDAHCAELGTYKQVQHMKRYWDLTGEEVLRCLKNKWRPERIKGKRKTSY